MAYVSASIGDRVTLKLNTLGDIEVATSLGGVTEGFFDQPLCAAVLHIEVRKMIK